MKWKTKTAAEGAGEEEQAHVEATVHGYTSRVGNRALKRSL